MSEYFRAPQRLGEAHRRVETVKPVKEAASKWSKRPRLSFGRSDPEPPVLITQLEPASVAAEAYRTLRTNLEFISSDRPCRNIAVTSPIAGNGKSTTAANLAIAAAQSGSRVCLVDADLRRPVLHEAFGLPNSGGLTAVLGGTVSVSDAARETAIPNLSLVVAGQRTAVSLGLLTSERLQKLFTAAGGDFDLVIYDTAPVLLVADSMNIAALCDGVILVVQSGSIPPGVLVRAVRQITQVNGRILGVLLNKVKFRDNDDDVYRYYRSYYGKESGK